METDYNRISIVAIMSVVSIALILYFTMYYSPDAANVGRAIDVSDVSGQAFAAQNNPARNSQLPTGGIVYSSKGIILTNSTLAVRFGKNIVAAPALNSVSLDEGIFTAADMNWMYQGDFRGYFFNGIRTDAGIDIQSGDLVAENGKIKATALSGEGNAYACIDSTGTLYRSQTACK